MTDVTIDPERRIAHVEGGAIWGQVNDAAHEFGLATPGGLVTHTGVGGFTTGGGFGLLSRAFGLACDNLTGAQVVTADGSVVECGPGREADLFWAIRGGGGNFGVVTRFDFRLYPVRDVVGGLTVFPLDASVIEEYLALIASTPKEFNAYLGLTKALPAPFLPEDVHGTPVAALLMSAATMNTSPSPVPSSATATGETPASNRPQATAVIKMSFTRSNDSNVIMHPPSTTESRFASILHRYLIVALAGIEVLLPLSGKIGHL